MKKVDVGAIKPVVLPKHSEVFAREIWGPLSGGKNCCVVHNVMLAYGGAEMHTHDETEHIFYILRGELKVYDGEKTSVFTAGDSFVIEAGEPHEITGTGRMDCEYLAISSPPVWTTK